MAHSRTLAAAEGLQNVLFQEGNLEELPVVWGRFDLIWSKCVLYFVPHLADVVAEFRRATKARGSTLVVLNDYAGLVLDPPEAAIPGQSDTIASHVLHLSLPRQLPSIMRRCGFLDLRAKLEVDKVFSFTGPIGAAARSNHLMELTAVMPYAVEALGSRAPYDSFMEN